MARGNPISSDKKAFVLKHYRERGAALCAARTGLTVAQVWGLAARLDVNQRRTSPVRTVPTRLADNGHRGIPTQRYVTSALEDALKHFTATLPIPYMPMPW